MSLKASFIFVTISVDIHGNSRRKNFINPSCLKRPEIIEIENDKKNFSHNFLGPHKSFITVGRPSKNLPQAPKKKRENKNIKLFSPLLGTEMTMVNKTVFCRNSNLYHFHFLNNRDT